MLLQLSERLKVKIIYILRQNSNFFFLLFVLMKLNSRPGILLKPSASKNSGEESFHKNSVVFGFFKNYPVPLHHYKSIIFGFGQYSDQSTILWSICKLWINPHGVDQFTSCGSIHNLWNIPQSVYQSTIFGSIHNMWISLQS